jgi:hypothetical protein
LEKVTMKKYISTISIVPVLVLLVSSTLTLADWSPGDDYKMHSPQLPNKRGYDICLVHQPLADDFKCSESGLIEDIHFWVSWKGDNDDFKKVTWNIALCANSLGQPGQVLWQFNRSQATITYRLYGTGNQGWLCPSTGQNVPNDHTNIYQVNITDISKPFYRTKDQIYWLAIQADMGTSTAEVGWKSSSSEYFGQAVYKPKFGDWLSIGVTTHDLAFVITGGPFIEVDQFESNLVKVELHNPGGGIEIVDLTGFSSMYSVFSGAEEGQDDDSDGDGLDDVATEMVALDLSGTSLTYGPIKMRLSPDIPSLGQIEEQANNNPGKLDLPPFTATGTAESFFDIFFELEIGGYILHNAAPLRWNDIIKYNPPWNASYESVDVIELFDDWGQPAALGIGPSLYRPGYCPSPIGDFNEDCIVNFFDFAIFASHWLECTGDVCP